MSDVLCRGNPRPGVRPILPVRSIEQKVGMGMDLDCKRLLLNDTLSDTNGHRLFKVTLGTLASFVVFLLGASSASATTLNVSGGQLLGASGVIVDGSSYDVAFLDGTCIALYNGCDSVSDFTFQTQAAAGAASQALLDQVFLDVGAGSFDSSPELTTHCFIPEACIANTPYALAYVSGTPTTVFNGRAQNYAPGGTLPLDNTSPGNYAVDRDTAGIATDMYAVWTPVPEPGTALLMALGLAGLSGRKRREG